MRSVADHLGLCKGQELDYVRQLQKPSAIASNPSDRSNKNEDHTGASSTPDYIKIDLRSADIPQDLISIAADVLRPV
jgi:hypothetical protein